MTRIAHAKLESSYCYICKDITFFELQDGDYHCKDCTVESIELEFKPKKKMTRSKESQRRDASDRRWSRETARPHLDETYGQRCAQCFAENVRLDVDHIIPRAVRRDLIQDLNNVQYLCRDCHNRKHNVAPSEWDQGRDWLLIQQREEIIQYANNYDMFPKKELA